MFAGPSDCGYGCLRIVWPEVFHCLRFLPLEYGLFDCPQTANLAAHLNFGVTVGLQYRLGQIAEEVVVAVTMRRVGKLRRNSLHERILLI